MRFVIFLKILLNKAINTGKLPKRKLIKKKLVAMNHCTKLVNKVCFFLVF